MKESIKRASGLADTWRSREGGVPRESTGTPNPMHLLLGVPEFYPSIVNW